MASLDDEALALLYDQVRAIAGKFRRSGFRAYSLSTTALANETLLKVFSKLIDKPFESQQHLVNTIAKVMYHLLCESSASPRRSLNVASTPTSRRAS